MRICEVGDREIGIDPRAMPKRNVGILLCMQCVRHVHLRPLGW